MKTKTSFWSLTFLLFAACTGSDAPQESATSNEIRFEKQEFKKASASCETDSTYCARISASYPMAVSGPEDVRTSINDTLLYYVKNSLAIFAVEESEIRLSMDTIAQRFIEEYDNLVQESEDYAVPWEVETQGEVLFQTEKVVSMALSSYSYAGGAHPNSYVSLLNFNLQNGKKIVLSDLIADIKKLEQLVEARFREVHELGPEDNLGDSGFFWGENFALPANYAITEEGLYFVYNPYEAAAYVLGPTELTIPYENLENLLQKEKIFKGNQ